MAGRNFVIFVVQRKGWLPKKRIELIKDILAKANVSVRVVVSADIAVREAKKIKKSRSVFIIFVFRAEIRRAMGVKKHHPEYNVVVFTRFPIPEEKKKGVIVQKLDKPEDVRRVIPC